MSRHRPSKEVELYREEGGFTVLVDLAGFDREDVAVSWHRGRLHVTAEHHGASGRTAHVHRDVGFPTTIAVEGITATFEDGILEVRLPIRGAADLDQHVIQVT